MYLLINLQKVNGCLLVPALLLFVGVALTSTFSFHNHRTRKILVGSFGLVASVLMYSSPLVAVVCMCVFKYNVL